jgi:hypothetical protein
VTSAGTKNQLSSARFEIRNCSEKTKHFYFNLPINLRYPASFLLKILLIFGVVRDMRKLLFPILLLSLFGCEREFEPELKGKQAFVVPARPLIHLNMDGRETTIELPALEKVRYRFAQWTKFKDEILLTQITEIDSCNNYQIIAVDTTGAITDTVYIAPPNTALNFKLAPNDSLLLLKIYNDDCEGSSDFRYTFYNRYSKTALPDTITVRNSRGILLDETIWSPDSKKVILSDWAGSEVNAFTYNLISKDSTFIDEGTNFIWSPTDNDLVAYIKDYSIYTRNMKTGEEELIYKGKRKKRAYHFRWDPKGEFLMVHYAAYILNIDAPMFQSTKIFYLSMKDKSESKVVFDNQRIETWK